MLSQASFSRVWNCKQTTVLLTDPFCRYEVLFHSNCSRLACNIEETKVKVVERRRRVWGEGRNDVECWKEGREGGRRRCNFSFTYGNWNLVNLVETRLSWPDGASIPATTKVKEEVDFWRLTNEADRRNCNTLKIEARLGLIYYCIWGYHLHEDAERKTLPLLRVVVTPLFVQVPFVTSPFFFFFSDFIPRLTLLPVPMTINSVCCLTTLSLLRLYRVHGR